MSRSLPAPFSSRGGVSRPPLIASADRALERIRFLAARRTAGHHVRPERTGAIELTALTQAITSSRIDDEAGVDPADVDELEQATGVDAETARRLVDATVTGEAHGAHPAIETPAAIAALERRLIDAPPRTDVVRLWWAGLSAPARAALGERAPLAVGNLDGVPWPARVAANHRTLAALIARRGEQQGARRHEHSPERRRRRRAAHERLVGTRLDALAHGPGVVARDGAPRFLLAFDPARRAVVEYVGQAIASTDDPFASPLAPQVSAVGVFVPGNESDLAQFEGKAHTMSELVHAGEPGETGLIVWQGGAFPHGPQGFSSAAALRLAPRLGRLVNAIPRDPAVRFVAFGFSFGGSVVGTAMRLGMRVDAVVHVASAGLGPGVRSLADYPASADVPHLSMLAPGDHEVAPFLGVDLPRGGRGIGHGADPTAARGVTRLETGFLSAVPHGGDVATGREAGVLRGHASLLEQWGTTAKRAMSAALTGGEAELAAPRTRLERVAERLGLPWSPLQRATYEPRFTVLPGGASAAAHPAEASTPAPHSAPTPVSAVPPAAGTGTPTTTKGTT